MFKYVERQFKIGNFDANDLSTLVERKVITAAEREQLLGA